jgi:hypothetical protein
VAGERANDCEAHYPSSSLVVNPAVGRRKRLNLPWEICGMSRNRLRVKRFTLTVAQKSAEGKVGHAVGEDMEALQCRKAEQTR